MWFPARTRMPYHEDPDYRDSLVKSIKQRFGDVPVDVRLLASWGMFEVFLEDARAVLGADICSSDVEQALADELAALPLVGVVSRPHADQMRVGTRIIV